MVERNYQDLSEEVDDMRKVITMLRKRYTQSKAEISDLKAEFATERADLFDSVQSFESEAALYKDVLGKMIDTAEMDKLLSKCRYDIDNRKWEIPFFAVLDKRVFLSNEIKTQSSSIFTRRHSTQNAVNNAPTPKASNSTTPQNFSRNQESRTSPSFFPNS